MNCILTNLNLKLKQFSIINNMSFKILLKLVSEFAVKDDGYSQQESNQQQPINHFIFLPCIRS